MLAFEEHASLLLVLHAVFALGTVAVTTHLVFWLRPMLRGKYAKRRAVLRFALLAAGAYVITMVLGMALYPTYKVRVRGEYLDNPSAITRATEASAEARAQAATRNQESEQYRSYESAAPGPPTQVMDPETVAMQAEERVLRGARISRWFDVKEHWSALGLMMAGALAFVMLVWKPSLESASITKVIFALAIGSAALSWAAAIIGLLTTAFRSVAL